MNRPPWQQAVADAVMGWWLGGIHPKDSDIDRDLAEWWTSDAAPEAAIELVDVVSAAIEAASHRVVHCDVHTRTQAMASVIRTVWPDVRAAWAGLGPTEDTDIVAQMVADDTLDPAMAEVLLSVLEEQS